MVSRKPTPWGIEFKSLCDGESGICCRLEIQEGAERMRRAKYRPAFGWRDRSTLTYVFNVGTTDDDEPFKRPRWRKVLSDDGTHYVTQPYWRSVPCPEVVRTFYRYFSAVDIHDHHRQGTLAFHDNWGTKTWWHRVYSNVIAICIVDAFFAYRLRCRQLRRPDKMVMEFPEFLDKLAYKLVNEGAPKGARPAKRARREAEPNADDIYVSSLPKTRTDPSSPLFSSCGKNTIWPRLTAWKWRFLGAQRVSTVTRTLLSR